MNLLNNDLFFLIIIAILIGLFIYYRWIINKKKTMSASVDSEKELNVLENDKRELLNQRNDLTKEREILEAEKKKSDEKNRKTWQMSEAIYKEREIIASENEKQIGRAHV
jgi:hypothetical protein